MAGNRGREREGTHRQGAWGWRGAQGGSGDEWDSGVRTSEDKVKAGWSALDMGSARSCACSPVLRKMLEDTSLVVTPGTMGIIKGKIIPTPQRVRKNDPDAKCGVRKFLRCLSISTSQDQSHLHCIFLSLKTTLLIHAGKRNKER